MLDLSELLKTQCYEFVDVLNKFVDSVNSLHKMPSDDYAGSILSEAVMLKTKLSHLQAVVEHEKLVNRVNAIAIIKKPTENTMKAGSYYNRSSVDNCDRGCRHDDSGTGGAVGNKCKQDDSKSGLDRDGFVDNKCGQDDRKPETDCIRHDTLKNECEQDDCKALVGCNQDDTKPELKEDNLKTVPIKDRLTKIDDTLYNDCKQDDIKPMINCDRDAKVAITRYFSISDKNLIAKIST